MERHSRGGDGSIKQPTKTLRKRLQRQLEFYLSESNLRQDKFLQQHMDEHGFLAIDLFLSFNKVKSLGATAKMVREAVEKSTLVRISEDGSAIAAIELPFDKEDTSAARTLYIENFAVIDDHDSLRKRLSTFGKVNLVSMPRFPQSKRFKGFAFVEFASAAAAERAAAAALAQEPELQGLRAMPKAQWLEMKRQLKEQLAAATSVAEYATDVTSADAAASGKEVELLVKEDPERTALRQPTAERRAKKRQGEHVRFDADDADARTADGDSSNNDDDSSSSSKRALSLTSTAGTPSGAANVSKKQKAR